MAAVLTDWSVSWPALGCYAVVAVGHVTGLARLRAAGDPPPAREAAAFQSGLLLALLALVSPCGYWADRFLWIHALQFIVLAVAGTGLMVLGAPWLALRQVIRPRPGAGDQPAAAPVPSTSGVQRTPLPVRYPVRSVTSVLVIWAGWQLPALSAAVRGSGGVALVYHVTIVAAGLLFWLQLIGSRPLTPAAPPLRRLALIVASVGVTTIGGMVLVFGSGVLYSGYANQWHHVMTVLDDQQLSGAVFWMGMLPPLIVVAISVLMRWLSEEESADLSAGLDRLLTPRKNAWSARPGIR